MNFFQLSLFLFVGLINSSEFGNEAVNSSSASVAVDVVQDNEKKSLDEFECLNSYKLPSLNSEESSNEELIASLKKTISRTFYDSLFINQSLRHERPGDALFFGAALRELCAEFRASKPSIDPNSFTKSEKFAFIERLSEAGMFFNVGNKKSPNKKMSDVYESMKLRAGVVSIASTSHYCRDALRIVAGVLDSNQTTWLLHNSIMSVLSSSEFLNQLNDFSMFESVHVYEALNYGHYDWFKNPKALKTLTPAALLGFFEKLNFDLTDDQMDLLNESRPINELFETSEFMRSSFAWQLTAGTKYFNVKHVNIDIIINEISNSPDNVAGFEKLDKFKKNIFALYINFEYIIHAHLHEIVKVSNLLPNYGNPDGSISNEDFESFCAKIDSFHEDYQLSAIKFNMDLLEVFFTQRYKLVEAITKTVLESESLKESLSHLLELLSTPSLFLLRQARTIVENFKSDFSSDELNLAELLKLLKESTLEKFGPEVIYRKYALILAYFDLKNAPTSFPYRHIPGTKPFSSLNMVNQLLQLGGFNNQNENSSDKSSTWITKWPKIFLIQQAFDFKFSKLIQLEEFKDEENIQNTLNVIINGFMIFCDHQGFSNDLVNHIEAQFPGNCEEFVNSIKNYQSIENRFNGFSQLFKQNLQFLRQYRENFSNNVNEMIMINYNETKLMALIQNVFEIGMVELLMNDSELLNDFSDFAYLLTRNQVKELLIDENGRRLLAENRNLLHNLPTYEDFKVTDLKSLKLQAQYANMVRTLSVLPLLISLKSDEYILNDPLGLSMRLFSFMGLQFWAGQANGELINHLWRIVPIQAVIENWRSDPLELQTNYAHGISRIRNYLTDSKEVKGKPLESIRAILHWIILQEIRFLEGFTLMHSQENDKWKDAINVMVCANQTEQLEREYLVRDLLFNAEFKKQLRDLGESAWLDLFDILKGPLSQIRAASLLTGHNIMDKNIRFLSFSEYFIGFNGWINAAFNSVRLNLTPARTDSPVKVEVFEISEEDVKLSDTLTDDSDTWKGAIVNFRPEQENNAHTNIPQYRQFIEEDCRPRREKLSRLLDIVNVALGNNNSNAELWGSRIELLGVLSADGFTLSPNYTLKPNKDLNVTIHERVIHRKLLTLAAVVDSGDIPAESSPEKMANTIIRIAQNINMNDENTAVVKDSVTKSKKSRKDNKKKRK